MNYSNQHTFQSRAKKYLLLLLLALISCGEVIAQQNNKFNYQMDIGASLSIPYKKSFEIISGVNGYNISYSSDVGYFLEFLVSYNLNRKFSISSGLTYNYISFKVNEDAGIFDREGNLSNSCISLPVLVNYRMTEKIPITLSAGAYVSYLISAREKGILYTDTAGFIANDPNDPSIKSIEPEQDYNNDITEYYTSVNCGLLLQLSYDFLLNNSLQGVILIRFNYGLKNVNISDRGYIIPASDWRNYSLLFGVGIKL